MKVMLRPIEKSPTAVSAISISDNTWGVPTHKFVTGAAGETMVWEKPEKEKSQKMQKTTPGKKKRDLAL